MYLEPTLKKIASVEKNYTEMDLSEISPLTSRGYGNVPRNNLLKA